MGCVGSLALTGKGYNFSMFKRSASRSMFFQPSFISKQKLLVSLAGVFRSWYAQVYGKDKMFWEKRKASQQINSQCMSSSLNQRLQPIMGIICSSSSSSHS